MKAIRVQRLRLHHRTWCFITPTRTIARRLHNTSFTIGSTDSRLDTRTLVEWWQDLVKRYPQQEAVVSLWEQPQLTSKSTTALGVRLKYEEFDKEIDQAARGLYYHYGLRPQDRVALYLGSSVPHVVLFWAAIKIGAIPVLINPAFTGSALSAVLNLTAPRLFILNPQLFIGGRRRKNQIESILPITKGLDKECQVMVVDNTFPRDASKFESDLKAVGLGRDNDYACLLERKDTGDAWRYKPSDDDYGKQHQVSMLQFTSGTTGLPKAVALTHSNILNNGFYVGEYMHLKFPNQDLESGFAGESLINSPPLFHCFGIVLGNIAFWTHAGKVIFPSENFSPIPTLRALLTEKPTAFHGVPTMFNAGLALLDKLERGETVEGLEDFSFRPQPGKKTVDFSSLRTGIAAGSPVPITAMHSLTEKQNLRELTITYGQTETSPATIMSVATDPLEKRCETVGRVMPHAKVRLVDQSATGYPWVEEGMVQEDQVVDVPRNKEGEIWTAGYATFRGYWGVDPVGIPEVDSKLSEMPANLSKGVLPVGKWGHVDNTGSRWIRTGDLGVMDDDGYVRIVGRCKDLIIRGGENLFPVMIENCILGMAELGFGVADCAVIAVDDKVMGEVPGVFVMKKDRGVEREHIVDWVRKELNHQNVPEWIWFMGEDGVRADWPKTGSGKIRKVELRDWAKELKERGVGSMRNYISAIRKEEKRLLKE